MKHTVGLYIIAKLTFEGSNEKMMEAPLASANFWKALHCRAVHNALVHIVGLYGYRCIGIHWCSVFFFYKSLCHTVTKDNMNSILC